MYEPRQTDPLDVDAHSIDSLVKFFKLPSNQPLTDVQIEQRGNELTSKLMQKTSTNPALRSQVVEFIQRAKNRLIASLSTVIVPRPPRQNAIMAPNMSRAPHFPQDIHVVDPKFPNPMNLLTKTAIYTFNTVDSAEFPYQKNSIVDNPTLNGDTTGAQDYTFSIDPPIKNCIGLSLAAFQFPNIQYTFSHNIGNNKLFISVPTTGVQGTIIMPDGYYTVEQNQIGQISAGIYITGTYFPIILEAEINRQLYGVYNSMPVYNPNALNTLNPFAVNVGPYTNKITITNTQGDTFDLVFDMPVWDSNVDNTCTQRNQNQDEWAALYKLNKLKPDTFGFQIGYRQISYSGLDSYTTESDYDNGNSSYVFFCLDEYANNYIDTVTAVLPNSNFNRRILAMVPISGVPHFSSVLDTGANFVFKSRNYTGPIDISRIVVSVYSARGIKITFNQRPFTFSIETKVLYETPTVETIKPPYY